MLERSNKWIKAGNKTSKLAEHAISSKEFYFYFFLVMWSEIKQWHVGVSLAGVRQSFEIREQPNKSRASNKPLAVAGQMSGSPKRPFLWPPNAFPVERSSVNCFQTDFCF